MVSTWSSGTGGAGILGATSYAGLIASGVSPVDTIRLMLVVPLLEAITFWGFLRNPRSIPRNVSSEKLNAACSSIESRIDVEFGKMDGKIQPLTMREKLHYVPHLMVYIIPLTLVYFLEYFINQGLVSSR